MTDLLEEIAAGRWRHPATGEAWACPVRHLVLAESLDGDEAELVARAGLSGRLAVVADENTFAALGERVHRALNGSKSIVLQAPHADMETAERLAEACRHADGLVAVGSGTLNDLCKYVSYRRGTPYVVFATAPSMNGYVTATASLDRAGMKLSLKAASPTGAFFDLEVLRTAPSRLIRAGFGDALSRTSAQVDWLLSHRLRGTSYDDASFRLQAADEAVAVRHAGRLAAGDPLAVGALTRLLILGGLGMLLAGSSAPASQGEHLISHYIDMLAEPHPGTLHGEQVAVATLSVARLQAGILAGATPPRLQATRVDEPAMRRRFGRAFEECRAAMAAKALSARNAHGLNERLASTWPALRRELETVMLPLARLEEAMREAGLPATAQDLDLAPAFYRDAVLHARELRDRWTILDLADDADLLEQFVAASC